MGLWTRMAVVSVCLAVLTCCVYSPVYRGLSGVWPAPWPFLFVAVVALAAGWLLTWLFEQAFPKN